MAIGPLDLGAHRMVLFRSFLTRRQTDVVFSLCIALLVVLGVIGGRSDWLSDQFAARMKEKSATVEEIDGLSRYEIRLGCLPRIGADYCSAVLDTYFNSPLHEANQEIDILVADFNGDLAITLNGSLVHQTTGRSTMLRISPMRPIQVALPNELLREGRNDLRITVKSTSVLGGYIARMFIGERSMLSYHSEVSLFLSKSVPLLLGGALLLISGLVIMLGARHRESDFLLCGLISLSYAFSSLYDVLPVETPYAILQAIRSSRIISGLFIGVFVFSIAGHKSTISLAVLGISVLLLLWVRETASSSFEVLILSCISWMIAIGILLHAMISVWISGHARDGKTPKMLILASAFGLFIMFCNLFNLSGLTTSLGPPLRGYGAPAFMLIMGLELVSRFSDKVVRLERASHEMREAILETTRSLEVSHALSEAQRQSLLLQNERQRLMGDLHDGLAGSLISIQALAKDANPVSLPQVYDLSKHALLDLRLVVESLDSFDGDLAAAIAAFRERITPQYSGYGFDIHWDIAMAPMVPHLTPEISLGIFRILQEAIANARRHGAARNVWIRAHALKGAPEKVIVLVRDDGSPRLPVTPGFGMRNMARRAANFGAKLRFRFGVRGSVVILLLSGGGTPLPQSMKSRR